MAPAWFDVAYVIVSWIGLILDCVFQDFKPFLNVHIVKCLQKGYLSECLYFL